MLNACVLQKLGRPQSKSYVYRTQNRGPREPWHDLHCRIEGPAAYDVLLNFEQRWRRATRFRVFGQHFGKVTNWRDDALLKIDRISWILSPSLRDPYGDPNVWVSSEEDSENWHVQVFRSIDSGSVKGFPKFVHKTEPSNLICEKNLVIDKSIHTAYVKAIRSAQHFIYIENQYFLGSSFGWPSYENAGADNLIPMELALKIASKIRAGERFAVYIVIPMWPEGVPTSNSVQEILFWQGQTIKMMYSIIGQELKSTNFDMAHPQDYLNFYCLGNREPPSYSVHSTFQPPIDAASSEKYRRFMIYVHAKGMIIDDEFVILGSANINQRSLDGSRDTEIAMGAYQPHHTWAARKRHPQGQVDSPLHLEDILGSSSCGVAQVFDAVNSLGGRIALFGPVKVYGYRMSLWAEHLGMTDAIFKEPHSLECVKYVNQTAQENWIRYTAEDIIPLKGHLLTYPILVDADGKVEPIPGQDSFPDFGGKVLGEPTALPDELTM